MRTKRVWVVAASMAALAGQLAYAHTELVGSMPADKAVLEAAPTEIMLHFSEPVRLTAVTVQKEGESKQSLGALPRDASEHFVLPAPGLENGHYTVGWRALSEDTHVMTGEFAFTVGASAAASPQEHAAAPAHESHSGHSGH